MQQENIIQSYAKRWQLLRVLEALLYGLGIGVCIGLITKSGVLGVLVSGIVIAIAVAIIKPWKITVERASRYIDRHLTTAEYSTSLLLTPPAALTGLGKLQQHKINQILTTQIKELRPKSRIKSAITVAIGFIVVGVLVSSLYTYNVYNHLPDAVEDVILFAGTEAVEASYNPPTLQDQKLRIAYPPYTGIEPQLTTKMNVKMVEGSRVSWELHFDDPVKSVDLEGFEGQKTAMNMASQDGQGRSAIFRKTLYPLTSSYYNFRFTDTLGAEYASEIYAVEVFKDKAPVIQITEIPQFTSFDHTAVKELNFTVQLDDDFGLAQATIIATVSKGSGESVKFREEKLAFDQSLSVGSKTGRLSKKLKLDALKMELGDELYFYVEASDQKTPKVNVSRSETFFAVIKDTVSDSFGVAGTLGADLMPDYFRSQRQLIIDTEKLIEQKSKLTNKEFISRSNELGFDQKSLRLKYGQFMGDEEDSGIAVAPEIDVEDFDPEDPTAGFRHDHDSENEHNLVEEDHADHDHGHNEDHDGEGDEESPLEKYIHNHDDPEGSTLFTESLRGKLKDAMAQMWDAELYLRLATPEASLPYQYKALTLIQEIKNSARIYVHRIGFDPPPIKEDKRLSGDLEEVNTIYNNQNLALDDPYKAMRESISLLEDRMRTDRLLITADREILSRAGEELALLAIKEPSRYLNTLQRLKWLTEDKQPDQNILRSVQKGLLQALPDTEASPTVIQQYRSVLGHRFIQELRANGH